MPFNISAALDVAMGLVLMYLALSLACTVVNETIATLLGLRASTLQSGLQALIDDPTLRADFYNHGLIDGTKAAVGGKHPSYLSSKTFALALLGSLNTTKPIPGIEDIRTAVMHLPDSNIRDILLSELTTAGSDVTHVRDGIARWFDSAMDRLGGQYKRNLKLISILVGLAIAILFNADTINVTKALWNDGALRAVITQNGDTEKDLFSSSASGGGHKPDVAAVLSSLRPFPLGWRPCDTTQNSAPCQVWWRQALNGIAGQLITALALSLGASFWFDVLSKFINLRNTGSKPPRAAESSSS